jgi:hypothetical protein
MKIDSSSKTFDCAGIQSSVQFSVANNAHVMKLLSDSLYKNKIAAPIRELSANALDSHIAAGKQNTPFDIHLPSPAEEYFSIRDYGTGMSRENLETLYTTYGVSEKTDSNDLIGCLGIGSKSPFAYTDSFIVVSYYQGRKFTYFAGKNAQGIPSLNFVSDEQTDDKNGLYIEFAVKENDYYSFWENAKIIYQFFPVQPNIVHSPYGEIHTSKNIVLNGAGWTIYDFNYAKQSVLIMGGISYPIETSYFKDNKIPKWYYKANNYEIVLNLCCCINATIGSVDIDISREGLQYTEKTINFIKSSVNSIQSEIQNLVNEKFKICKTRFEACCLHNEMFGSGGLLKEFSQLKEHIQFPFNIKSGIIKLYNENIINIRHFNGGKVIKNSKSQLSISANKNVEFYLNNIKTGGFSRCKYHSCNNDESQVIILTIPDNDEEIIKNCLDEIGITREQLLNVDILQKPQKQSSGPVIRTKYVNSYIYTHKSSYKTHMWGKTSNINYEDGGYYIKLSNYTPYKYNNKPLLSYGFGNVITDLSNLKWFESPVYGFCDYTIKKFIKNNPKWIELTKYIEDLLEQKIKNIKIWDGLDNIPAQIFKLTQLKGVFSDGVFKDFANIIQNKGTTIELDKLNYLYDALQIQKPQITSLDIRPKLKEVVERYPLLSYIYNWAPESSLINYVKLIDKQGE